MIAQVGDGRVAVGYDDIGKGPPVVFLHAFPLNRTMWAPQTSALAAEWRCLSVDIRGFGESTAAAPFTIDRYADDVVAVLDAAGVKRTIVVGLSMGGYVAFALWRRYPRRVRALVLADTRAGADSAEARERRRELIALAKTSGVAAVADRQMIGLLGKTTRERRPEIEASVRAIAVTATVDGVVGTLEAMLERPDSTSILPTVSIPTLIVAGDEDVLTPPKEARATHEKIDGSRLEILSQAGHLSSIERPAAFNAVLNEFLLTVESAN